ncbi:MAG: ATP-dependent Clp protease adaptor ClpS [Bacteroidota bacterium]|nr:ATP-dependent Clp protease adaptor ClpS [Bacteroidota bacterium]
MTREKDKTKEGTGTQDEILKELILYNDEVHSFEYVIETLIEICGHERFQAEQCTYIAHFKGKCGIKSGTFNELKPYFDELTRRELTVSID